jgi:hypothetical protein
MTGSKTVSARSIDDHVGEMLSGYIDGELTQQQRQRVEVHCDGCEECNSDLRELRALRERVGRSGLSELGEDIWREQMDDTTVRATRGIGWLLFIGGLLIVAGYGIYEFVIDTSLTLGVKLLFAAIYGGMGVLFLSVLRQRLIERKTDKYKDVEI